MSTVVTWVQKSCGSTQFIYLLVRSLNALSLPQGNWNKESMIRKLLNETSQDAAEWVWWMDADTLVTDMAIVPRFAEYEGHDLVVWGDRAKLMEGDMNAGACAVTTWQPARFHLHDVDISKIGCAKGLQLYSSEARLPSY